MININCIIIEDEVYARALILSYINKINNLTLKGVFSEPKEALSTIENEKIDLIFLDIEMPGMRGTEFLRKYNIKAHVIFTTAYSKYAVDAFELNVTDYLVKPITFDRFQQSIVKVKDLILTSKIASDNDDAYILMKDTHDTVKVYYHEINYIIASREYVEFFTLQKRFLLRKSLKSLETELPKDIFLRVHKSYIINITKIKAFNVEELKIDDFTIPIGRSYRKNIKEVLK